MNAVAERTITSHCMIVGLFSDQIPHPSSSAMSRCMSPQAEQKGEQFASFQVQVEIPSGLKRTIVLKYSSESTLDRVLPTRAAEK